MKNKPTVVFEKIDLEQFIEILTKIKNKGAKFINLIGSNENKNDMLGILIYEEADEEDDDDEIDFTKKSLTDNDIKNLL